MTIRIPVVWTGDADDLVDGLDRSLRKGSRKVFEEFGRSSADLYSKTFNKHTIANTKQWSRLFVRNLSTALQGGIVHDPRLFAIVGAAAVPAFTAAGTAAGGAFVLAAGAALAGIGIAVAAQQQDIKNLFIDTKEEIFDQLQQISTPFEQTLRVVAETMKTIFEGFAPALESSFARMAPVVSGFVRAFGSSFQQLAPALGPLTAAFDAILQDLIPRMEVGFGLLRDSFINLSNALIDNTDVFGDIAGNILGLIPGFFNLLATLVRAQAGIERFFSALSAGVVGDTFRATIDGITNTTRDFFRILNENNQVGKTFDAIVQFLKPLLPVIQETAQRLGDTLGGGFRDIARVINTQFLPAFQKFLPIIQPVVRFILQVFGDALVGMFKGVIRVVQGSIKVISGVLNAFSALFSGDWSALWDAIKQIATGAFDVLIGAIQFFLNFGIISAFRKMVAFLTVGIWKGLFNALVAIGRVGFNLVRGLFTTGLKVVLNTVISAGRGILSFFTGLFRGLVGAVQGGWVLIRSSFSTALRAIGGLVLSGLRAVRDGFIGALRALDRIVGNGVGAIIDGFRAIPGALGRLGRGFLEAGKKLMGKLFEGIRNAAGATGGVIAGIATQIVDRIKSLVNKAIDAINNALPNVIKIPGVPDIDLPDNPIPRLARGTRNFAGGVALVGEEGPEKVILPKGARVIPAGETARMDQQSVTHNVQVTQVFTGPQTGADRLRELEWTLRYATGGGTA